MKRILSTIISICIILILLFQINLSFAVTTTELNNEKNENNKEIQQQENDLKEVQANKSKTYTEIEQISEQISNYEEEIEKLDGQISTISSQIKESEEKIKEAEKDYENQQVLLNERLVTMYENGDSSYLDFILSSSSGLTDVLSNYFLVSELASYDTELLEKIEKQKSEIQEQKNELEEQKKSLNTTKATKASKQTQLKSAKTQKNQYVKQLSEEEQKIEQKIEQLKEDNKNIDQQIKAAQAAIEAARKKQQEEEARKKQQMDKSSTSTTSTTSTSSGGTNSSGFIRPVKGYSVTTGLRYSSGRYHGAVDFSGAGILGSPVYAVADGYVVSTHSLKTSYGNYIIIAHYNGLYTLYAHGLAGSIAVSSGQTVKQGQQIMKVGSTGNSTGPHLHFEVRKSPGTYANRVNPLSYLP